MEPKVEVVHPYFGRCLNSPRSEPLWGHVVVGVTFRRRDEGRNKDPGGREDTLRPNLLQLEIMVGRHIYISVCVYMVYSFVYGKLVKYIKYPYILYRRITHKKTNVFIMYT